MTQTLIQAKASGVQASGANNTSLTFDSTVTEGNLMVAFLGWVPGGTPLTDFQDDQGNTWTTHETAYFDSSTGYALCVGSATAETNATPTVTAVLPEPGGSFRRMYIHEVEGADTFDALLTANGGATPASSMSQSIALAHPGIVIDLTIWNSAAGVVGSGYTIAAGSGADEFTEYQVFASSGTKAVTSSTTAADIWMTLAASFYDSSGGGGGGSATAGDAITFSDAATTGGNSWLANVGDTISVSSSATGAGSRSRTAGDSLAISSSAQATSTHARAAGDTISISSSASAVKGDGSGGSVLTSAAFFGA